MEEFIDSYIDYEIKNGVGIDINNKLEVLDRYETIDLLLEQPKCLCRFGDGEVELMQGNSIVFQKYDENLAKELKNILTNNIQDLYVGIGYSLFHSSREMLSFVREFNWSHGRKYRRFFLDNANKSRTYIDAGFTIVGTNIKEGIDLEDYYEKIKLLFKERKITIFCGSGILDNLKYDIFELADDKKIIDCPKKNAFDKYDDILEKAIAEDKNRLLIFILGPTSKVLVYELCARGRLAWDLGHIAKDYNMYMMKIPKTVENINSFFQPD